MLTEDDLSDVVEEVEDSYSDDIPEKSEVINSIESIAGDYADMFAPTAASSVESDDAAGYKTDYTTEYTDDFDDFADADQHESFESITIVPTDSVFFPSNSLATDNISEINDTKDGLVREHQGNKLQKDNSDAIKGTADQQLGEFSSITFNNSTLDAPHSLHNSKRNSRSRRRKNISRHNQAIHTDKNHRDDDLNPHQIYERVDRAQSNVRSVDGFAEGNISRIDDYDNSSYSIQSRVPNRPTGSRSQSRSCSSRHIIKQGFKRVVVSQQSTNRCNQPNTNLRANVKPTTYGVPGSNRTSDAGDLSQLSIVTVNGRRSGSHGNVRNGGIIQKQLHVALKQADTYRKQNEVLLRKLDSSNITEAIDRYKALLLEKEQRIHILESENSGLKQISRHQAKFIESVERKNSDLPHHEMSQEKQIEILLLQVRKVRARWKDARSKEERATNKIKILKQTNVRLETQNAKLQSRMMDLSRQIENLVRQQQFQQQEELKILGDDESGNNTDDANATDENTKEGRVTVPMNGDSINGDIYIDGGSNRHRKIVSNKKRRNSQKHIIEEYKQAADRQRVQVQALEQSIRTQYTALQNEISTLKIAADSAIKEQQRLQRELNRRELFSRNQLITIRHLRQCYEELRESSQRLEESCDLYQRDQVEDVAVLPKNSPVLHISQPKPALLLSSDDPISNGRNLDDGIGHNIPAGKDDTSQLKPKTAQLSESIEEVPESGGNLTFLTSELDADLKVAT